MVARSGRVLTARESALALRLAINAASGKRCSGTLNGQIAMVARFNGPWPDDELSGRKSA